VDVDGWRSIHLGLISEESHLTGTPPAAIPSYRIPIPVTNLRCASNQSHRQQAVPLASTRSDGASPRLARLSKFLWRSF